MEEGDGFISACRKKFIKLCLRLPPVVVIALEQDFFAGERLDEIKIGLQLLCIHCP